MQMIIAAGCAASCLWNYVICSWNFRDETEMKLEFSRKFSLASNVRSLPLPIIFCYFVVSSWASPFVIIRNIDISFQLCVFEFIKLKIHPIIQIDIDPRCELSEAEERWSQEADTSAGTMATFTKEQWLTIITFVVVNFCNAMCVSMQVWQYAH